ncbi:MAG: 16S rRNA processing protein RimM [Bacteroidales bacterium]|nr:16S rRNA processing protein RimM [Bacteroidales bacterium]
MIQNNELNEIGKFLKPHGICGEIVLLLDKEVDLSDLSCLILNIDGINVPFYLNAVRAKSRETDLVLIDGITNEIDAMKLCGHNVFALQSELPSIVYDPSEGMYAADLIGYLVTANGKELGKITDIDDTTANYLFVIEKNDGTTCLIPISDEFIDEIDPDMRTIDITVPDALLEL